MSKAPELRSRFEQAGSNLVLIVESTGPAEVVELQTPRPSVDKYALGPPFGFESRDFDQINGRAPSSEAEARELKLFSMQTVRWVGSAKVIPGESTRLSIPAASGAVWFPTTLVFRFRSFLFTRTGAHFIARGT